MNLDSKIWSNLPTDLIRKIIELSNPSIDVQLCFKIPPNKLDDAKSWRLWYLLKSHDGIIYNLESKSLHILRIPGFHVIRRPIELSYHTAGLHIFNDQEEEHMLEVTCPCGCFEGKLSKLSWTTEMRILLRGSSFSRTINAFLGSPLV
jgi:hypothetical protein